MKIYLIKDEGMLKPDGFPVHYLSTSSTGAPKKPLPEVKIVKEFNIEIREEDKQFFSVLINESVLPTVNPKGKLRTILKERLVESKK